MGLLHKNHKGVRLIDNQTMERVGEIIEAGTVQFTAQCYELYEMPPLGSLVKTSDIYGIVANAATSSLEPGRRPIARGRDEASEEAVYRENPQLTKLLRSEFAALVVGHKEDGRICHYLSPNPARIHSFVYLCAPEEVQVFSRSFGFLNMLINAGLPVPTDELIAAALRQMSRSHADRRAFLVAAGKELAALLSHDFNQLKSILGRLQ